MAVRKSRIWRPTVLSDTRRIGVGQLRAAARHYIQLAAGGAPIRVMRRNKVVAQIQSLEQCGADSTGPQSVGTATVTVIPMGLMGSLASHCLDVVAAGDIVEVVDGDRPVARLVPYRGDAAQRDETRFSRHRIVGRDDRFGPSIVTERSPEPTIEMASCEKYLNSGLAPVDNVVAGPGSDGVLGVCKPRRAVGRGKRRRGRYLVCDRCGKCGPVGEFTLSEFGWECCAAGQLDVSCTERSAMC